MNKDKILEDYDNLLQSLAAKTRVNGYDFEDILQELRMVAMACADKFNPQKGTTFITYLVKSCQYKIKELRIKNRHYHEPLDELVGDGTTFLDMLADERTQSPEDYALEQSIIQVLDSLPHGEVTKMFILEQMSQIEIAEKLGLSKSYVNKVHKKNMDYLSDIFTAD